VVARNPAAYNHKHHDPVSHLERPLSYLRPDNWLGDALAAGGWSGAQVAAAKLALPGGFSMAGQGHGVAVGAMRLQRTLVIAGGGDPALPAALHAGAPASTTFALGQDFVRFLDLPLLTRAADVPAAGLGFRFRLGLG
jgi:hypothetical protein